LANNGGPTQTIALESGSPAINAGDPEVCANAPVKGVDQRGYVRATDCSIGAFEYNSTSLLCGVGDCNSDGQVSIDELVTLLKIALGSAKPSACPNGVPSDAEVDVSLIIQAVEYALNGCRQLPTQPGPYGVGVRQVTFTKKSVTMPARIAYSLPTSGIRPHRTLAHWMLISSQAHWNWNGSSR